jgi:hypothetical protein
VRKVVKCPYCSFGGGFKTLKTWKYNGGMFTFMNAQAAMENLGIRWILKVRERSLL